MNTVRKIGYKQTEVGVVPTDWSVMTLGRLVSSVEYGSSAKSEMTGSIPVLRMGNLQGGKIDWSDLVYTDDPNEIAKYTLRPGDVLFNRTNTIDLVGKSSIYLGEQPAIFAGYLIRINVHRDHLDSRYLNYVLNTDFAKKHSAKVLSVAVGQANINGQKLKTYPIPLPPTRGEQERIADALSDADALIESLERLVAKKRRIKHGAMQELLTGRKRLRGFTGAWAVTTLGNLAYIQRGASPRPIDSPIWFDDNSEIGWVRISDVTHSGMFLTETTQRLSSRGVQHSRPVKRGSLIMSICATVGRPIITEIETCIHDGFVVFEGLRADRFFVYYSLARIEKDWSRHGQTGSQMNLNTDLIKRTEIVLPATIGEQRAVAATLLDMDEEIVAIERKLSKARHLKQGMMQELLTGRIRLV
jgi:type I restriction enzyme, S subunit